MTKEKVKSLDMNFKLIKAGTFMMGSPKDENNRFEDETQHEVTIDKDFEMQTSPVTQEQWEGIMGNNPSYFKGKDLPVETVSWDDVQEFIKKLNDKNDGYTYRLPTEAEWEFAARGGTTTAYSFGDDPSQSSDYAWFSKNSEGTTHPVGMKKPNPFGLYDMHGNVWEWVQDEYKEY